MEERTNTLPFGGHTCHYKSIPVVISLLVEDVQHEGYGEGVENEIVFPYGVWRKKTIQTHM